MVIKKGYNMDIFKQISRMPNFGYHINYDNGHCSVVVLGQAAPREIVEIIDERYIANIISKITSLYVLPEHSSNTEKKLLDLLDKMRNACTTKKTGLASLNEQKTFIESLTKNELLQLQEQIDMYNHITNLYPKYH